MAGPEYESGAEVARKVFVVTMIGSVLFIATVAIFIL